MIFAMHLHLYTFLCLKCVFTMYLLVKRLTIWNGGSNIELNCSHQRLYDPTLLQSVNKWTQITIEASYYWAYRYYDVLTTVPDKKEFKFSILARLFLLEVANLQRQGVIHHNQVNFAGLASWKTRTFLASQLSRCFSMQELNLSSFTKYVCIM